MPPTRIRSLAAALALLPLAQSAARADYLSRTYPADGQTGVGGTVQIEGYDGTGPGGGGLSTGQVRLTVHASLSVNPATAWGLPPGFHFKYSGLSDFAFPSDVSLDPSQIAVPAQWTASVAPAGPGHYLVDVRTDPASTPAALSSDLTVLISGLGANAAPGHFVAPTTWGNGFGLQWDVADPVPNAPEPAALVLAGVGAAGLLGRSVVRRRSMRGPALLLARRSG